MWLSYGDACAPNVWTGEQIPDQRTGDVLEQPQWSSGKPRRDDVVQVPVVGDGVAVACRVVVRPRYPPDGDVDLDWLWVQLLVGQDPNEHVEPHAAEGNRLGGCHATQPNEHTALRGSATRSADLRDARRQVAERHDHVTKLPDGPLELAQRGRLAIGSRRRLFGAATVSPRNLGNAT